MGLDFKQFRFNRVGQDLQDISRVSGHAHLAFRRGYVHARLSVGANYGVLVRRTINFLTCSESESQRP